MPSRYSAPARNEQRVVRAGPKVKDAGPLQHPPSLLCCAIRIAISVENEAANRISTYADERKAI